MKIPIFIDEETGAEKLSNFLNLRLSSTQYKEVLLRTLVKFHTIHSSYNYDAS